MKKRLDCQQVHKVCLMIDRFVQALESQIEISHPDCREAFRQGRDVLSACQFVKFLNTFLGSGQATSLSMGRSKHADIQGKDRRGQALYNRIVTLLLEVKKAFIESRFRIVAIQLKRLPKILCS